MVCSVLENMLVDTPQGNSDEGEPAGCIVVYSPIAATIEGGVFEECSLLARKQVPRQCKSAGA